MNRLRPELIAGPHPVEAGVWLVYDPASGRQFEFPEEGWRLAEAFDGRSVAEIAADVGLSEEVVAGFSDQVGALGLWTDRLAPAPGATGASDDAPDDWAPQWSRLQLDAAFTIAVHPEATFTCTGAGTCCEQGYVIPLTPPQAASVRRAALRVLGPDVDPVGMVPTAPGQPWTFALDNERSCPFLDEARRCRIHERAAYPDACRIFPFVFAQFGGTVFASVAHRCACGAFGGAPLSSQRAALASRARRSGRVYTVPERTRLDRSHESASAPAVAALHAATSERSAFAILRAAVSGLAAAVPSSRGRRGGGDLVEALEALTSDDVYVAAALAGGAHPRRREVRRAVRRLVGEANEIHSERSGSSRRAGAAVGDANEIHTRRGGSSRREGATIGEANEIRARRGGSSRRAGAAIGDAKEIRARRGGSSRRADATIGDANEIRASGAGPSPSAGATLGAATESRALRGGSSRRAGATIGDAKEIRASGAGPSPRAGATIGEANDIRALPGGPTRHTGADVRDANEVRSPRELAHLEATRFVRDHLFGLRLYHYATLAEGLVALTLAAHHILTDLPRRDPHIAARERVMLWEEALTTNALPRLMTSPSPDLRGVAALIDALEPT
ncbi:MAG: YkgJ family cysteine cluster protein [Deltaproteobacteria bacterium]